MIHHMLVWSNLLLLMFVPCVVFVQSLDVLVLGLKTDLLQKTKQIDAYLLFKN
jgi:hypothetical protein